MAKVNRFYKQPTRRLINPLSMQEMAYAPTMLRQQHDKVLAAAAENFVLDADTLTQDQAAARQALNPIEDAATNLATDITKNGYSPEKFAKMMQIESQKRQVERDVTSKLTARKQQIQGKLAEISEKYKDNVRVRDAIAGQFQYLNQEGATLEDGKLNMPGMRTPFMAEYMSDEKLQEMVTDGISKLKANARALMGDQTKSLPNDVVGIISTLEKQEGVSRERITKLLQTSLGNDVLDRFRMDATVSGIGLSSVSNDPRDLARDSAAFKEAINSEINNLHKTLYADEINRRASREDEGTYNPSTEERQQIYNEIAKGETFKRAKDQIIQGYRQQVEQNPQGIGKLVVDKFAQNALNEYILGMSDAFAYEKTESGRERRFQQFRDTSETPTNFLENIIPTEIVYGTQGMKSQFNELSGNTHNFEYDANGNLATVKPSDKYLQEVDGKQFFYVNKDTGEMATRDQAIHPKGGLLDRYKKKFVTPEELVEEPSKFKPLQELKKNIPNSQQYSDRELIEGYQAAVNKSDAQTLKSYRYFDDKGRDLLSRANETMLGIDENGKYTRAGTGMNLSNFTFSDGKVDSFKEAMDRLGFDVDNEVSYREFAEQVSPRITGFIPQLGRYSVNMIDSDGNSQSVLMEPDNLNLKKISKPSKLLYEFSKSGKVLEVLDGQNGRPYLGSDVEGKVMVAYNNMGDIFTKGSRPQLGYVEVDKEDVKYLSGTNIDTLIKNGKANFIPQEQIDFDALEMSTKLIR